MQEHKSKQYDAIILGAGAAGLMCAIYAAKRGLRIALIDHNRHAGRKIAISGGGKANFTNIFMHSDFYSAAPDFIEPALDAFQPKQMLEFFKKNKLSWEEREHGQLFGLQSAKLLANCLVKECLSHNCHFFLGHELVSVCKNENIFTVLCQKEENQQTLHSKNLILALGSSAWSGIGATDFGLQLAKQFGHSTYPFSSALTSLQMPKHWPLADLSGISLRVGMSTANYSCIDDLLFTHSGLSGPVTLQNSLHWKKGNSIQINFLPNTNLSDLLDAKDCAKLYARNLVCRHMPQRLADKLLPAEYARRKIAELSRKARNEICQSIHEFKIIPQGICSLDRAEAALGGVNTKEVNPWSMESYIEKNLYIIGELLDVTGQLGGYNLHWAWASGYVAGQSM